MKEQYIIRRALPENAFGIHEAHMKSIQELCSKDYTEAEIKAWGYRPYNEEHRLFAIANHILYIVTINDSIEGYAQLKFYNDKDIKKAHVMGLYLTSRASRKNIGTQSLQKLIVEAQKEGVQEVTLESTLTSKEFYLKNGFSEKGSIETISINGQEIRCIPMSRSL
jgi:L-amino acid N-acyltransferase YncA